MSTTYSEILTPSLSVEQLSLGPAELLQREHYDRIAADYEAHYGDAASLEYRRRFIYQPMFDGLNLEGMNVLDAMCGSGHMAEYVISRRAALTGIDISPEEIRRFRDRWPEAHGVCRSLLDTGMKAEAFDCVAVVGGLHHLHPHLGAAIREIHRLLKPGGTFCFMEPHAGSFPDVLRRLWYRCDSLFSDNEAAIDTDGLQADFAAYFTFNRMTYQGNIAFLLVLNSLVFRIPLPLKPIYSPALMACEAAASKLQSKSTACYAIGQWRKK